MSHRMRYALLVMIVLGAAAPSTAAAQTHGDSADKPAVIRLALDRDRYADGDWAAALVMTRDDGYVIVIQVDPDRVAHVIFPASPRGDAFVRAGDLSVRGAHGRYSFEVKGSPGSGLVYAAYSTVPFQFAAFTRHGKWAISSEDSSLLAADPERALAQIVERMSSGPFNDDLVQYDVPGADAIADIGADTQLMAATDFAFADCGIGDACAAPGGGVYICGGCGDAGTPGAPPPALPPPPPPSTPPMNLGGPATAPRIHYPDPPRVDPAPPTVATPAPASPRPVTPPLIRPFAPPSPTPTQPPPAAPQPGPRFEPPHVELHPAPPPPPPPAPPPPAPPAAPPPTVVKPPL
jgi:hypothetical protein